MKIQHTTSFDAACTLISATVTLQVTDLSGNTGCGFKPRYRKVHSGLDDHLNVCFLSLGVIPSAIKNPKDVDKWSSLSLCLSVRGVSIT